jgi:hypothetical protein
METKDIQKRGKSFLTEYSNYNHEIHVIDAYSVERGITQYLKNGKFDGLAIITEGKSDLAQYFSPSVTENLISMLDAPIISIRAGKQ